MVIKRKNLLISISVFLLFFILFMTNVKNSEAQQRTVVINPGHSVGYDTGAASYGVTEAQVNETLAGRVVELLLNEGYKVYITHTTDSSLSKYKLLTNSEGSSLKNVGIATNSVNPDLALAIHHNSGGTSASGFELYWSSYRDYDTSGIYTVNGLWSDGYPAYRDNSPCYEAQESERFAEILKNYLSGQAKLPFRKIVERDDYLPAHAKAPCVLYEGGFISNPTEAAYLDSEAYIADASYRIVQAIDKFFGTQTTVSNGNSSNNNSSNNTTNTPNLTTPNDSSTSSSTISVNTPIMGNSGTTAEQLVEFYNVSSGGKIFPAYYKNRGVSLQQFAQMYVDECKDEGVRVDVAFAQAMHETGFLMFGGSVDISQFNFAGIGATDSTAPGYDFSAVHGDNATGIRMGIRGQVQHLKAYGSTEKLVHECVDPRFNLVTRGSAKTVGGLSQKWAVGSQYGDHIVSLMKQIPRSEQPTVNPDIPENSSSSEDVIIYRLLNPKTGEHLYTSDSNEANILSTSQGWDYEGIGWKAPVSGTPVYRLFSPVTGNHLFTTDTNEVKQLSTKGGWTVDFDGKPLFYSGGDNPVYRLYHSKHKQHLLTTDYYEYNNLPSSGWTQEGVALQCK